MKLIKFKAATNDSYSLSSTIQNYAIRPEDIVRLTEITYDEVIEPEMFSKVRSTRDDKGNTIYEYKKEKGVVTTKKTNTSLHLKDGVVLTAYNLTIADIEKLVAECLNQ